MLSGVEGVGEQTFWQLVGTFGGPGSVLRMAREGRLRDEGPRLRQGDGARPIPRVVVERIEIASKTPLRSLRRIHELGLWTLTPVDPGYPARLQVLDQPPPVLYGWGDAATLRSARSVAVVGTRRPTLHGRALAARVAARIVDCGATVVSGLAIGIDGAAHAAAVERKGSTVAVIGSGHGEPGPRSHRGLLQRIVESGGSVIGELPPDAAATPGTFPRRNRLISALADAVVVVEAPARSGALITAHHALEQGRQLFVAPGRPADEAVAGCLALLRETPARPLVGLDEFVADLGYGLPLVTGRAARLDRDSALTLLPQTELAVAQAICAAPGTADAVASRTRLPPPVVAGAITLLLMRGWIQSSGPAYLPAGPLLVESGSLSGSSSP